MAIIFQQAYSYTKKNSLPDKNNQIRHNMLDPGKAIIWAMLGITFYWIVW